MSTLTKAALGCYLISEVALAQPPIPDDRHEEVMMPCRDGVKLETIINYPRDMDYASPTHTAVMDRSPYGYGDMEWMTDLFLPAGFIAVGQDMRGTEKSEGNFTMWQQDKDDSQDLGNWITSQTWSNGEVMTLGASADGIASYQTPFHDPTWLAAQYIIWAPASMYKVLFPHGCYKQETTEVTPPSSPLLHNTTMLMPMPDYCLRLYTIIIRHLINPCIIIVDRTGSMV
jgi:predicted acyl esterase